MCVPGGRGVALRPGRTRSAEGPGADQDPERPLPAAGLPGCQAGHRGRDSGGGRTCPDHEGFGQRGGPERAAHRIRRRHGGRRRRADYGRPGVSFLGLDGKTIVVFGVANKKSVAYQIGQVLEAEGATVVYVVRSKERKDSVAKLLPKAEIHLCDVARDEEILAVARDITNGHPTIHGLVHSIARISDRKSTRLNSSHSQISYAVFCLKKKN